MVQLICYMLNGATYGLITATQCNVESTEDIPQNGPTQ